MKARLLGGFRKVHQMRNVFGHLEPFAYALFRIVFGLLFLQFGTQKLFDWPSTPVGYTPTALMQTAACIELTCGFLIMIGLVTDFAAFLASGEMAFAYFLGHFPIAFWPVVSRGVPAVLFCFAFLFIAARGAGEGKVAARRLTMMQVYNSAKQLADVAPGLKLACCLEGHTPDELSAFYRDVAFNRGAHIQLFLIETRRSNG